MSTVVDGNLAEILEIENDIEETVAGVLVPGKEQAIKQIHSAEKTADFKEVRDNLRELINTGDEMLDGIMRVARMSDHPRAFEVAGQIMGKLAELNRELLQIHREMEAKEKAIHEPNESGMFISMTDITKMLDPRGKNS